MKNKNELYMNDDLKCIINLIEEHFKTIYEDSVHKTKEAIKNEAGEKIYYDVMVKDTSKNKRYEVRAKKGEEKYKDIMKDNLPADFISGDKYLGGVV